MFCGRKETPVNEPQTSNSGFPWDRITAISSALIALLALISSCYQADLNRGLTETLAQKQQKFQDEEAEASRIHRKLSVKPILVKKRDLSLQVERPGLFLENRGAGPAIIYDLVIFKDRELLARVDSEESVAAILAEFDIKSEIVNWLAIRGTYAVLPGEDIQIFGLPKAAFNERRWRERFSKAVTEMGLGYCYCSIYEECWKDTPWAAPEALTQCNGVDYTQEPE